MGLLQEYGYRGEQTEGVARVLAVHRERYELICDRGRAFGRLKPGAYYADMQSEYPTTGDYVAIEWNDCGDSRILATLPRFSKFSRNNFSGHAVGYVKTVLEQLVAANFDEVFILASLNHDFSPRRIERYLALAWQSGAQPVVVPTKQDVAIDLDASLAALSGIALGAPVHVVSAVTGYGLPELSARMTKGKTIVFLGSSGVGKSSLVNALAGEVIMTVREIREDDSRGRHTTTHRQMIKLPSGTLVIDTPGMRELGMWDAGEGLDAAFADVDNVLSRGCKFSDCRHKGEPGCVVAAALASGELSRERWESYLALAKEARFVDDKSAALREKEAWAKQVANHARTIKKSRMMR